MRAIVYATERVRNGRRNLLAQGFVDARKKNELEPAGPSEVENPEFWRNF